MRRSIMRNEASLRQWKELYELTRKIKNLEPWKYFWDMDLLTIILPERKEPIYFSILGNGGQNFGILTYSGYDAYNDFIDIIESEDSGTPVDYLMLEQSCLACNFGNREEVPPNQKKIIKELALGFRGKNQWIYFESFKKGYMPYILDEAEVILLTEAYNQLLKMLLDYIEQHINISFESGKTLIHYYDEDQKQWVNKSTVPNVPRREIQNITLADAILKADLKGQKKIIANLELDMLYVCTDVKDDKFDRPINPKIVLLADNIGGAIIQQEVLTPEDNEIQAVFRLLIGFIQHYGIPQKVYFRIPLIKHIIEDLCTELGIQIIKRKRLKAADKFKKEFLRFT